MSCMKVDSYEKIRIKNLWLVALAVEYLQGKKDPTRPGELDQIWEATLELGEKLQEVDSAFFTIGQFDETELSESFNESVQQLAKEKIITPEKIRGEKVDFGLGFRFILTPKGKAALQKKIDEFRWEKLIEIVPFKEIK